MKYFYKYSTEGIWPFRKVRHILLMGELEDGTLQYFSHGDFRDTGNGWAWMANIKNLSSEPACHDHWPKTSKKRDSLEEILSDLKKVANPEWINNLLMGLI